MSNIGMSEDSQMSSMRTPIPTKKTGGNKRWTTAESRFFIRFMASQVEQGFKVNKGFKPQAVRGAIIAMKNEFGVTVTKANVTNHLRTIHKRWAQIKKLKELSGMRWDTSMKMIIMGDSEFRNYIEAHPQDEPYLNKQIEDHDLLEIICRNDQATGRHVVQFGDNIGTHMDDNVDSRRPSQTDSVDDMFFEEIDYHYSTPSPIHNQSDNTEPKEASSTQSKREKRKRKVVSKVEAIQELNDTIKKVLSEKNEKKSTKDLAFAKELIGECMKLKTHGYSSREINKAYDWLMGDDSRAMGFLAKDEELRKYWAEDFFEQLQNQGKFLRRPT